MSAATQQIKAVFVIGNITELRALESSLADRRSIWNMVFCTSGADALDELATGGPCDVIVGTLRLPFFDGSELLHRVKDLYPDTLRIIASDFSDLSEAVRLVPAAHQYLTAPIEVNSLSMALERSVDLQTRSASPGLKTMLNNLGTLPTPPLSVLELNLALMRKDISMEEVSRVVESDAAMTAQLLGLVNSAFFGLRHRIYDASHAVSYLGLNTVRNLLSSVELIRALTPLDSPVAKSLDDLQLHSLGVAEVARELMTHQHQVHDAFAAGVLHDIGLTAAAALMPERYLALQDEVTGSGKTITECEVPILGASHADLGAYVLSLWGLPFSLVEAVSRSHDADTLPDRFMSPVHAVFVAEQVMNTIGKSAWEGSRLPDQNYLIELGIDDVVNGLLSDYSSTASSDNASNPSSSS